MIIYQVKNKTMELYFTTKPLAEKFIESCSMGGTNSLVIYDIFVQAEIKESYYDK